MTVSVEFGVCYTDTLNRSLILAIGLVRFRMLAILEQLRIEQARIASKMVTLLFALPLRTLSGDRLGESIFALLLDAIHSVLSKALWSLDSVLLLGKLAVICRQLILTLGLSLSAFDTNMRQLIDQWLGTLFLRIFPLPQELHPMVCFAEVNLVLAEWRGIYEILTCVIPGIDHTFQAEWMRIALKGHAQHGIAHIERYSETFNWHYLSKNTPRLLDQFLRNCCVLAIRGLIRGFTSGFFSSVIDTCSLLRTESDQHMIKFINYLNQESIFLCTSYEPSIIEFSSRDLLGRDLRARFQQFSCARPSEFTAASTLTCFGSFHKLSIPLFRASPERLMNLNFPPNHVVVSSRNSLTKRRIVTLLMKAHNLTLLDDSLSCIDALNELGTKGRDMVYAMESFTHIWTFFQMEIEGVWRLSPQITSKTANYYIDTAMLLLTSPNRVSRHITRFLWRGVCKLLIIWTSHHCTFYLEGRLTSFGIKCLSILGYFQKVFEFCKFPDAYQLSSFKLMLDKLAVCIEDAKLRPEIHPVSDLDCAQITLDGCRRSFGLDADPLEYPAQGIFLSCRLGTGTFGTVYRVHDSSSNRVVALKEIDLLNADVVKQDVAHEVSFLRLLKHPNIVSFYDATIVNNKLYIKTGYCSGGPILTAIPSSTFQVPDFADVIFRRTTVHLLLGLAYLHFNEVVHGDLKPANILMDGFERIQLVDFGSTRALLGKTAASCRSGSQFALGTLEYMAPETVLKSELSQRSDIWSVGCTLFHLVTGEAPWHEYTKPWGVMFSMQTQTMFSMKALDNTCLDSDAKALIASCLKYNPSERPTATELLLSPFLYDPLRLPPVTVTSTW